MIIFFTLPSAAFPFQSSPDVVSVTFNANFANGTRFETSLLATEAVITSVGDGSEGTFEGAGASWWGSGDMERWGVEIDAPGAGVVGTLRLDSVCRVDCGVVSQVLMLE